MTVGDNVKYRNKIKVGLCALLAFCIFFFGTFCTSVSMRRCFNVRESFMLLTAKTVMPDGSMKKPDTKKVKKENKKPKTVPSKEEKKEKAQEVKSRQDENTFPVEELNISSGELKFENIEINNSTSYEMDTKELLNKDLDFTIDDTKQAQVLIVHTHSCESYLTDDVGYYYESFYPRTTDNEKNIVAVGKVITDTLKENGIYTVHATVQHDNPSYDGAYDRSYDTIMEYLEKYKEIKVVLDIHRDSMVREDNTRLKPTFTYKGKKAAQIMIMTGHDVYGDFPTWESNLSFALKLQKTCEDMYEGMTRPLNFGDFTYNMNVNSGSLLIEVGTDANTLSEAKRTGKMLANALSQVLQK